ncbi:MAG: flagellar assembly peptidoglycan hydrolase FlgJ [Pseudomonadales bacterium]|nr:flagellar assembly peptidoglycan hydrolase FlgJ [Pseudomonadales bacterium]NRA17346.1 flagellar assembly peptidoglycan hydrolase FlgJ [Oceanospirillaceae bacterium]
MSIDNLDGPKHAKLYSDLSSLQELKTKARNNSPEALREVAKQFEQIFLSQMLKSMRDANESFVDEDSVFSGGDVRFYQDMMDQQMTMEMAQGKGIGLTDVLVRQLSNQLNIAVGGESTKDSDTAKLTAEDWLRRAYGNGANLAATAVLGQHENVSSKNTVELKDSIDELQRRKEAIYQQANANMPERFSSPQEFVAKLMPLAERVATELGVDPKVLLAQAALETGWGKHMVRDGSGENSFNLFNIKAGGSWQGDYKAANTLEFKDGVMTREVAKFRSYATYEDSFQDYVQFLKNSPRYQEAINAAADPHKYLKLLQQAGYATDPKYADKISSIYNSSILENAAKNTNEG